MAILFFQVLQSFRAHYVAHPLCKILQKEAEAWSCSTVFPPIILEEVSFRTDCLGLLIQHIQESTADLMFRLIVWPPAAERGDEDERYKVDETYICEIANSVQDDRVQHSKRRGAADSVKVERLISLFLLDAYEQLC